MSWGIERRDRVAVVTMNTNKVNAQNHEFFADPHAALDTLERAHAHSPVVLTGRDGRFSAGLDLDRHFELFAGHRGCRCLRCSPPGRRSSSGSSTSSYPPERCSTARSPSRK